MGRQIRSNPATLAKAPSGAEAAPARPAEHIYIASEDGARDAAAAREIRERIVLRNPLRRTRVSVTLFAEGFAEIVEERGGKAGPPRRLDLHYLDPVPQIERVIATGWLRAALAAAGAAALAGLLAQSAALAPVAAPGAAVAAAAAAVALAAAAYLSHERIEFATLHGRAPVLTLVATLGAIRRFRELVPAFARAIEESAQSMTEDTAAYLRAEMREHYRLRGEGVLSHAICADSTGRILAQFDVQL
jgi:hypothetical protein